MRHADVDEPRIIGSRIGPHRILRELGAGGLGAVFLAELEDDLLHMKV
ncbi:hypothetical protein [Acanthopleuribacter pedis]|uniref:Serine/threonine protein kinase n=1 Tax=Acanthopleuribacter pedis TaxID=442870 RepID=A0A8J7QEC5_9BACT|nr:hypothetical protein [Acanthopleuribacter pedis]MBO1323037.1 hypothetical protein [Acanthopleuribacter pedis]